MSGWDVAFGVLWLVFCACLAPLAEWEARHWEKSLARDEARLAKLLAATPEQPARHTQDKP